VPEHIAPDFEAVCNDTSGAYICQNPADFSLHSINEYDLYSMRDVSCLLYDMEVGLNDVYPSEVLYGVATVVMGELSDRCSSFNESLVVASFLKYYFEILELKLKWHNDPNPDETAKACDYGIPESSSDLLCVWSHISPKTRQLLKYVGTSIWKGTEYYEHEDEWHTLSLTNKVKEMLASKKLFPYKKYVFDRSSGVSNTLSWLKSTVKVMINESRKAHPGCFSDADVTEILRLVDIYAPSSRSSSSGGDLTCENAVFAPKPFEGRKLVFNLLNFHLPHHTDGPILEKINMLCDDVDPFFDQLGVKAVQKAANRTSHKK